MRKIVRFLYVYAGVAAGNLNPQIQLQFTPLHWGLEFSCTLRNRVPQKAGIKVGPIAVGIFCRRILRDEWEFRCKTEKVPSITYEETCRKSLG